MPSPVRRARQWLRALLPTLALLATGAGLQSARTTQAHALRRGAPTTDSATVVQLERDWLANEHDSSTLERVLAPDFRHAIASGQFITKAEHIAWITTHKPPHGTHASFERLDVRVFGKAAIATGIVRSTDGATDASRRTIFTDIFARRDGRWQAVAAQETGIAPA